MLFLLQNQTCISFGFHQRKLDQNQHYKSNEVIEMTMIVPKFIHLIIINKIAPCKGPRAHIMDLV